jgi:alpha-beta hydrolase superfamily lysophospholipase
MESQTLTLADGHVMHYYLWSIGGPTGGSTAEPPRATIQIAHGMGEHAARYDWVATQLNAAGFAVYAQDHRGHGRSSCPDNYGDMGEDGWNRTISDAAALRRLIGERHPGLPHALLGHSMGAMLAQQYLYEFGDGLDAVMISGSPGFNGAFQGWLSHLLARFESWRLGPDGHSEFLQNLVFGKSNEPFETDGSTGFEWLSRDQEQVAAYVADDACGFVLRAGSLAGLMAGSRAARKPANISRIPAQLPVYVFSGSADPVHGDQKGLNRLLECYRAHLDQVDFRMYQDGRHEMFNELNRQEVVDDLVSWLQQKLVPEAVAANPG